MNRLKTPSNYTNISYRGYYDTVIHLARNRGIVFDENELNTRIVYGQRIHLLL